MKRNIIDKVTSVCSELFADKKDYKLPEEYDYGHLPLCVIDSVFSIGVKYEGVQNTVNRFCDYFKIDKLSRRHELTTTQSLLLMDQMTVQDLTEKVFKNRQRTSPTNGILKSEAVILFLKVLQKYKVELLNDIDQVINDTIFENEIKQIKGQNSGISLKYFFMLAGSQDLIKPDRMIVRFLEAITGERLTMDNCQLILTHVSIELNKLGFKMTPKILDNLIWNHQRVQIVSSAD